MLTMKAYFDGSKVHYKRDGSVIEEVPGDFYRETTRDGTVKTTFVDGTLSIRYPNGIFKKFSNDGQLQIHVGKDGSNLLNANTSASTPSSSSVAMDAKELQNMQSHTIDKKQASDSLEEVTDEMFKQTNNILKEIVATERTFTTELGWYDHVE